jgi:hypothetical protein
MLTNKKQGKTDYNYTPSTLLSQPSSVLAAQEIYKYFSLE